MRQRKRQRLRGFDYAADGAYFITICVQDRACVFGDIRDDTMILNSAGQIVRQCWQDLPHHYSHCVLDAYCVMPNHVHGIVMIAANGRVGNGLKPFPTAMLTTTMHDPFPTVAAKHHGLSEIIRGFKTFSSRRINASDADVSFRWQKSFHDRIIRHEDELQRIREYIVCNPQNWNTDVNHRVIA